MSERLHSIAKKYPNTRFVAVRADQSVWLAKKFKVKSLPSLILTVDGTVVDKIVGLADFGDTYDLTENAVIRRLRDGGKFHTFFSEVLKCDDNQ